MGLCRLEDIILLPQQNSLLQRCRSRDSSACQYPDGVAHVLAEDVAGSELQGDTSQS